MIEDCESCGKEHVWTTYTGTIRGYQYICSRCAVLDDGEEDVVDADTDVCGCCDLCDYCYCHWT